MGQRGPGQRHGHLPVSGSHPRRVLRWAAHGTRAQRQRRWFLAGAHLALVVLAVVGAVAVHAAATRARVAAYAGRDRVVAQIRAVTSDAQLVTPSALVTYVARDGLPHEAQVVVGFDARPGDAVGMWVDAAGRATTPPDPPELLFRSVAGWVGLGSVALFALLGTAYVSWRWSRRRDRRVFAELVADIGDTQWPEPG